jgi:hypothetical protein
MKKLVIRLSMLCLVIVFCMAAASAKSPLDVIKELSLKDDRGNNWILKNAKEYNLKWSISDKSPYQHFELYKGPNGLVYAQSFDDLYAINSSTGKVEWKRESDWQGSNQDQVGIDGSVYKFDYEHSTIVDKRTVQVDITRYSAQGLVTNFTAIKARTLDTLENIPFYQTIHTANTKGDFIILTNGGLLSFKPDGSQNWLLNSLDTSKGLLDLMSLKDIYADNKGNIVIMFKDVLVSIKTDGNVNWAQSYKLKNSNGFYSITPNGYFLEITYTSNYQNYNPKLYRITEKGLVAVSEAAIINRELSYSDQHSGIYQLDDRKNMLSNQDYFKANTKWTYQLTKTEKQSGYSLYNGSLAADPQGNVYFGSNVGTVYSLDYLGKPRFTLNMKNRSLSYPDIIPISDKLIVIAVNNQIACIEKIGDSS